MAKRSGLATPIVLALILILFWFSYPNICSIDTDSPTYDEANFIAQGIYIVHKGDYSLAIHNPPLSKIIIGLATLGMNLDIPSPGEIVEQNYESDKADPILNNYVQNYPPDKIVFNPYYIGYHLIYDYNRWDAEDIFTRCRRAVQLAHYILVFLLFLAVRRLFGPDAGIVAAALAFFDPNMVAHGHLCTTDMPAALFSVASLCALLLVIATGRLRWPSIILWGISIGLLCAVKYSCLILLPVHAGVFLWAFRRNLRNAACGLVAAAIIALAVCYIIGGFSLTPYTAPIYELGRSMHRGRESYFLGHYSRTGFALYYPATILFKMPTAALLMLLGGIVAIIARIRSRMHTAGEAALWLMPGVFLLSLVIFHGYNLGIRHTLVIYPFLLAIGSSILPRMPKIIGVTGLGLIFIALVIAESVPAMQNSIPFFNLPSRKAAYEGRLLADSNIDWGQDLARLRKFCLANNIRHLRIRYFGTADPDYHIGDIPGFTLDIMGAEYNENPGPPGWYAVSLQRLLRIKGHAKDPAKSESVLWWLKETEPYAYAGRSIFIYRYGDPGA